MRSVRSAALLSVYAASVAFCGGAWAADDATAEYGKLQQEFEQKMRAAKDETAQKSVYLEHATQLSNLAAAQTGQSAEVALIDSAVYFRLGGELEKSEKAFIAAKERASFWPAKMQFLRAAAFLDDKHDVGKAYAVSLMDEAAGSGSKVDNLSDMLREYGDTDSASALIDRYLKVSDNDQVKTHLVRKKASFAIKVGAPPIDFDANDRQTGKPISLSSLKGKVVLLDFWATWCGPCLAELPNVIETYSAFHGKGFEIVGVSLDEDLDALDKFIREKALPWPEIADGKGWQSEIGQLYAVNGIPFTVIIGRDGLIKATKLRGDDLKMMVEKLLQEKV